MTEGWKCITNDPFIRSIVKQLYRLHFTGTPFLRLTSLERSPEDQEQVLGMQEQTNLLLRKKVITEVLPETQWFYSNVFLVSKASGGWRPIIDFETVKHTPQCTSLHVFTISYIFSSKASHLKLTWGTCTSRKIHLDNQNCLHLTLMNKLLQFSVLPFSLNTAPQVCTHLAHTVTGYFQRQGILVLSYPVDWLVYHRDQNLLLNHQSILLQTLELMGFKLILEKLELNQCQRHLVPCCLTTARSGKGSPLRMKDPGDSSTPATYQSGHPCHFYPPSWSRLIGHQVSPLWFVCS